MCLEPDWMCTAAVTKNKTVLFFATSQCCDAEECFCVVVESFISHRSDSDSSGLFRCDPSVQISPRETLNPRSTAKSQGCCSVADTPRWPLCTVSPTGATENRKLGGGKKGNQSMEEVCSSFHESDLFTWNALTKVKGQNWNKFEMKIMLCVCY